MTDGTDSYVHVALIQGRGTRPREPRFVELNNEISDDVASRIDASRIDGHEACLSKAHLGGAARSLYVLRRM